MHKQLLGEHGVERFLLQTWNKFGRQGQINRIDRHRTDRVVGAVVIAGFIDRKDLQDPQILIGTESNRLPNRLCITDAEVFLMSQGKYRHQCTGESWIGGFGHKRESRRQIAFPASLLLSARSKNIKVCFATFVAGEMRLERLTDPASPIGRHRLVGELAIEVVEEMGIGHQPTVSDAVQKL